MCAAVGSAQPPGCPVNSRRVAYGAAGELHSADVNGSAIKVFGSDNSWVLAFGRGLSMALYGLACALFGTASISASGGGSVQPERVTLEDAATALYDMVRYLHLGIPIQQQQRLSPAHKAAAGGRRAGR
jgi:hypothetical protein